MSSLKVVVLGCSGTYASPGGACSGYLVDSQDTLTWLDAGPGTLANLQLHTQLEKIDALVLTHEHGDHWLELPIIYNAFKYYLNRKNMPVYGTSATKALAEQLLGKSSLSPVFDFQTVSDGDELTIGNQTWRFSATDHPVETMAVRVNNNGSSFGFSADTGPNWDSSPVSSEVDLFLCEATFPSDMESRDAVHLSARQAGKMAQETGVKRLIVTHAAPEYCSESHTHEASEAFGGLVEAAEVNAIYSI